MIIGLFNRGFSKNESDRKIANFVRTRFGVKIKNPLLYREAFTHKSYISIKEDVRFYERLEFLGDAILDAVIADYLFIKFPEKDEGFLTKLKAKLVSRKNLSKLANELDILPLIRYKKSSSIKTDTIAGNAFEALIGALYLDLGYNKTKRAIENHLLRHYINMDRILTEEIDFKSKLLIWSQRNRHDIDFAIINEKNFGNRWEYTAEVVIDDKGWGVGTGSSKKSAEQKASQETLILLGEI